MKFKTLIYKGVFVASLLLNGLVAAQEITISFSESYGNGVAIEKDGITQFNRLQINKIRVDVGMTIEVPLGPPRFETFTLYYDVLFKACLTHTGVQYLASILTAEEPVCEVDNLIDLTNSVVSGTAPDKVRIDTRNGENIVTSYFWFDSLTLNLFQEATIQTCAKLQVRVINAQDKMPVPFAQVTVRELSQQPPMDLTQPTNAEGHIQFENLLAGHLLIGAYQEGFQMLWSETDMICSDNFITLELLPLPPPRQVRIILDWADEQRLDLDAHLTGPDPGAPPSYQNEPDRFHLYFGNKLVGCTDNHCLAEIHYADDTLETKPETITLSPPAGESKLRPGTYRLVVHQFAGTGSLMEVGLQIRLQIEGQPDRVFTPPPWEQAEGELANDRDDIWRPFKLEVSEDGQVIVTPAKKDYTIGISPAEVI